jgi:hypothetical protein
MKRNKDKYEYEEKYEEIKKKYKEKFLKKNSDESS